MKLYTLDRGWHGGICIVAKDRLQLAEIIEVSGYTYGNANNPDAYQEHDIVDGTTIEFLGDV